MQSLGEIEIRAPAVGAKIGVFFCMSGKGVVGGLEERQGESAYPNLKL